MSIIKVLKFLGGITTEIDSANDSIVIKSIKIGGTGGTELVKADLDTLISGLADASSLHSHNTSYFQKSEFIDASAGVTDAAKPMKTNGSGKLGASFILQTDIDHGSISGLADDDHGQYHTDARGDIRYFQKSEFINASTGAPDAAKPVKTNASGKIASSFIDLSGLLHNDLGTIQGGTAAEYYHLTSAQHTSLTGAVDASSLHNHNTQYYTKAQMDISLGNKADSTAVILRDGTQAMLAALAMGGFKITSLGTPTLSGDASTKQYVDDLGSLVIKKDGSVAFTGNQDMGGFKLTGLGTPTNANDAVTKAYSDAQASGVLWYDPINDPDVVADNVSTPPTVTESVTYLVSTSATGAWTGKEGHLMSWSPGTSAWIDLGLVVVGSRIGISMEHGIGTESGSFGSKHNQIATVTNATPGSYAYTYQIPVNARAVFVSNPISEHFGHSYNYNGTSWTEFGGPSAVNAGTGLAWSGNTLNVLLGAGIVELPSDEVGIDVHANGGLMTTIDNSTPNTGTAAQLAIKLNGATLNKGASGLSVSTSGITSNELATDSVIAAKIAADAVTTDKILDSNVTANKLATDSVTTIKIANDAVDKTKIAADIAGLGLSQAVGGELDVNVDGATIEINVDTLRVKDLGISTAKIANAAINDTKIDFGTGANQVNAADLPIVDTADNFAATTTEAALAELAAGHIAFETSGESISTGDLVVLRRDGSNALKLYKANADNTANEVFASLIMQDLTYTSKEYSGNYIRVRYVDPGSPSQSISVSVTSNYDITVNLATDGGSAITSTATQIKAAIEANTPANALVLITISGTGANIQTAQAYTNLANGMSWTDNGRWNIYGMSMTTAGSGNPIKVKLQGKFACAFVTPPVASDIGKDVFLSINAGQASVSVVTGSYDGVVYIGRLVSTTEIFFRDAVLRGVLGA